MVVTVPGTGTGSHSARGLVLQGIRVRGGKIMSAHGFVEGVSTTISRRLRGHDRTIAMRIALYQPDIPQNTGTLIRLATCLGLPIEVIEPCGFPFSVKALRRSGMDYLDQAQITHQASWDTFIADPARDKGRLILLSTRGDVSYTDLEYQPGDTLLLGRESAGVPQNVHDFAHATVVIPLKPPARSLNVAVAAAMVVGEALRQTGGFPSGG